VARRRALLLVLALATSALVLPVVESLPLTLGVFPAPATRPSELLSYPVRDLEGNLVRTQAWRVVNHTGNCCENFVMTTPDGRIFDLGGDSVLVSSDEGVSWQEVVPGPQLNGEGSIAYAPDGDIVGIVWDAYSGDRLTALRLRAGETLWETAPVALHRPFYDRPWLAIAPGPFVVAGVEHPYAVLLQSGYNVGPPTENTLVSLDGLTYLPSPRHRLALGAFAPLDQPALAWADWVQPAGHGRLTPLPGGGMLATTGCPWARLGGDLLWECMRPSGNVWALPSVARFDSLGRLHLLSIDLPGDTLRYRLSEDGGRTWRMVLQHSVPGDLREEDDADLVVNGALDRAAMVVRYKGSGTDRIEVLTIDGVSSVAPRVERLQVGLGDAALGSNIAGTMRLDFVTLAMLPDGRVVTSFADSRHHPPVVAVQQR